ncbi:MAG: type II secretion system protein [Patescibacteria group bacterium]
MLLQAKNSKGFTLVELIVVITILAILATIGFLSLQGYTSDAKNTKTRANLRTVSSSLVNEQAITQQSFDYYLSGANLSTSAQNPNSFSGTSAAFTGTTIYGSGWVSFTGSAYNAAVIDPAKLRIDGAKFFDKNATDGLLRPYAMGYISANETSNGKTRQRTLFQVAATLNNAGVETALVEGTYGTGANSDTPGLIKTYNSNVSTYTSADAVVAGTTKIPYTTK